MYRFEIAYIQNGNYCTYAEMLESEKQFTLAIRLFMQAHKGADIIEMMFKKVEG